MNSGGYLPSCEVARLISTTFTDTEVNNCFSIYHTSWKTRGPKSNFIGENVPTKAILFFFGCSEVNSTWLITSELANQHARKVLFSCVVYTCTNYNYCLPWANLDVNFFYYVADDWCKPLPILGKWQWKLSSTLILKQLVTVKGFGSAGVCNTNKQHCTRGEQ